MLFACGDEGVLVFDWDCLLTKDSTTSPSVQFQTHPSPLESSAIEVNEIQILDGRYLFGAAGDSFGVYKWDLETEKLLANYSPSPGSGYFHSIQLVPAATGENQCRYPGWG